MTEKFAVDVSEYHPDDRLEIYNALEKLAGLNPSSSVSRYAKILYFEGEGKLVEHSSEEVYRDHPDLSNTYPLHTVTFDRTCRFHKVYPKELVVDGKTYVLKED